MDRGLLVVMAISDGSCLTVLAASSCDVGVVAYGMTVLVTRAGDVLTPASRPSSKPPSAMSTQHPHGGRSRIAGRRASRTGRKPTAAGPGSVTGPPLEAPP
jgi:ribosomal protein L2